jgi:hypothetical protein
MSQFDSLFKPNVILKTDTNPKTNQKKTKQEKPKQVKKKTDTPPPSSPKASSSMKNEKRTTGKSSNPDYTQVLTYVRRDTHNAVRAALIFDQEKRDLSDLVEELLAGWVKSNSR